MRCGIAVFAAILLTAAGALLPAEELAASSVGSGAVPSSGEPARFFLSINPGGIALTGPELEAGWLFPGGWRFGFDARALGIGWFLRTFLDQTMPGLELFWSSFAAGVSAGWLLPLGNGPFLLSFGLRTEGSIIGTRYPIPDSNPPFDYTTVAFGAFAEATFAVRWMLDRSWYLDFGLGIGAEAILAQAGYYSTYPSQIIWDPWYWEYFGNVDLTVGFLF